MPGHRLSRHYGQAATVARVPGTGSLLRMMATLIGTGALAFIAGCVMRETYGDPALAESERAIVEGYWHYRFLYDEELHIASVDGERGHGRSGWPYAYSISLPAGPHWLDLSVARNSREVARCAVEWTFESGHRYKLQRLEHDQLVLAHPSASSFPASIAVAVTDPAGKARQLQLPAVCGTQPACRQSADCAPSSSCQTTPGLAFGACIRPQAGL